MAVPPAQSLFHGRPSHLTANGQENCCVPEADPHQVLPLVNQAPEDAVLRPGCDPVFEMMKQRGLPLTREYYLEFCYSDGGPSLSKACRLSCSGGRSDELQHRGGVAGRHAPSWGLPGHKPANLPESAAPCCAVAVREP